MTTVYSDRLYDIARGAIERSLGDVCDNPDDADQIYEAAFVLAHDALVDAGVSNEAASDVARQVAQELAQRSTQFEPTKEHAMTTETKTLEQLQEEARVAAEALQAAQQAAAEKAREIKRAKDELERQERLEATRMKERAALEPLLQAMRLAGMQWESQNAHDTAIVIGGKVHVRIEAETSGTSWSARPTGRYMIVVSGGEQQSKRYPPTKAGHSYDRIITEVRERLAAINIRAQREKAQANREKDAEAYASQVREDINASPKNAERIKGLFHTSHFDGRRYHISTSVAPIGKVYFSVNTLTLTKEQAQVLADALDKIEMMDIKERAKC